MTGRRLSPEDYPKEHETDEEQDYSVLFDDALGYLENDDELRDGEVILLAGQNQINHLSDDEHDDQNSLSLN